MKAHFSITRQSILSLSFTIIPCDMRYSRKIRKKKKPLHGEVFSYFPKAKLPLPKEWQFLHYFIINNVKLFLESSQLLFQLFIFLFQFGLFLFQVLDILHDIGNSTFGRTGYMAALADS